MVWAAVTEPGRSPIFFVDKGGGGVIEPAELSKWHPCWCIVALDTRALQKPFLVFSVGLCIITGGQKDSRVTFRKCSALHYQCGISPIFPRSESSRFWDQVIPWENILTVHHQSLETLTVKLKKEWAKTPHKVIRDSCKAFSKHLQLVINADGGHIELYFGNCLSKLYSTYI